MLVKDMKLSMHLLLLPALLFGLTLAFAAAAAAVTSGPGSTPPPILRPRPQPTAEHKLPYSASPIAKSEEDKSPTKPVFDTLLKPKSVKRVNDDHDLVVNAQWTDQDDYTFVDAGRIGAPMHFVRPMIMDFSLYPKMSTAIKKFEYNPRTQIIEVIGEQAGLRMHSWVRVDQRYWDEIRYDIVGGDMYGFKVQLYLWDMQGKTNVVINGLYPNGKKLLPTMVTLVFRPLSEIVLSVATKNFRRYIEEEYKKKK